MAKLTKEQFCEYIKDHIQEYLPPSFDGAQITIQEVTKANDVVLTGFTIRREDEQIVPNIYLEQFFDRYRDGEPIDKIVGDIADVRIDADISGKTIDVDGLLNYDSLKDRLQIRLCDAEQNRERLKGLVSLPVGDFAKTFHVCVGDISADSYGTIAVTPSLMNSWGISAEKLNADALAAEDSRKPALYHLPDMMDHMMSGGEPRNLLGNAFPIINEENQMNLFCLTTKDKTFGASLMVRDDILAQAATALGGSFFVLPSSVHEVLIVPETNPMTAAELSQMVHEINSSVVSTDDFLSDKVQFYDSDTRVLENAMQREAAKEMEHSGKRPSLTEQLAKKTEEARNKPMKMDSPRPRNEFALG